MRKQQKRKVLLGVVILLGVVLAACSPRQSIIGKWENINEATGIITTVEFKSNGVFEVRSVNGAGNGIYTLIDADAVMFVVYNPKVSEATESGVWKFVVAGDTLTVTLREYGGQYLYQQQPVEYHTVP